MIALGIRSRRVVKERGIVGTEREREEFDGVGE